MAVVLGLKGPPVTSTIAFALAVIAGVSLLVSSLSSNVITVSAGVDRIRLFKGESVSIPLAIGTSAGRWVSLASISLADESWATGKVRLVEGGEAEVVVAPKIAGRFEGLIAVAKEVDPLGLFEFHRSVKINVELESLPTALRKRGELPTTAFGSVGENPSGRVGTGQEMFGITNYQSGLGTKDIMWKRVAKMGADHTRLPMRMREGSTKRTVRVGLAVGSSREQEKRDATVDKVSEALGQLGSELLVIGATIEVVFGVEGHQYSVTASNMAELGDLVIGPWIDSDGTLDPKELATDVDLLILESNNLGEVNDLAENGAVPLLVVSTMTLRLPPRAVAFTGQEDLTDLAGWVLTA